jgi:hypothetical protein
MNPQTRYLKGWLSFDPVTSNHTSQADYYLRDPEVFQIKSTDPRYYWLIETRNFNATMTIGTTTTVDYNYYPMRTFYTNPPNQGVLVWRVDSLNYIGRWGYILHAGGQQWPGWPLILPSDLFPGTANVKVLSPWSDIRNPIDTVWVPNTKPSTNVGMEITGEGNGYYMIDFYNSSPQNASPAKPQNLAFTTNNQVTISWTNNNEPDRQYWEVWRKYWRSRFDNQDWTLVATRTTNSYTDPDFQLSSPGNQYSVSYKIRTKDNQNLYSVFSDEVSTTATMVFWKAGEIASNSVPKEYSIFQNYPNPFNPTTTINYQLPAGGFVSLKVYDVLGRTVANLVDGYQSAGYYAGTWNAQAVGSGLYFYRLTVKTDDGKSFTATKKMLLTK